MNILALDLSTKTGFAHSDGASGVWMLMPKQPHEHGGWRFAMFGSWLGDFLDAHETDAIAYEKAHHRGGPATRLAIGLITTVETVAAHAGIHVVQGFHTGTIKKHATGHGNAKKPEMAAAAIARNPTMKFIDDNHVDALFLLDLALSELSLTAERDALREELKATRASEKRLLNRHSTP